MLNHRDTKTQRRPHQVPNRLRSSLCLCVSVVQTLWIVGADLHWESVRIENMKTVAASLLINRSGSSRLEIGSHGFLVEVVDSDREMVHFGCGLTLAQHQKVFTKHELVVPV